MITGIHFDLTAKTTSASNNASTFQHGEDYPAIIAGLWAGKTTWQDQTYDGFAPLFIVKDENGKLVPRAGKFLKCYEGYHLFNGKTAFAQLMQGLLGTTSEDTELQRETVEAGYDDLSKLIGKPCSVRMAIKKTERGAYAIIDSVSRPTAKRPGLEDDELKEVQVDVSKVFGRFITIPDPRNAAYIKAVKLLVAVNSDAIDENLF